LKYEVVEITDSEEALSLFKSKPDRFDLVITDMAMPNMAGDHLAEELMKIRPDIPIILCTGHSDHVDENKAKELGIRAYVIKPITMGELANIVRRVLDES
jgi:CheY-like chemotaxis protein